MGFFGFNKGKAAERWPFADSPNTAVFTNIRILHIYIGYVVFIFTLTSQSLIGVEPWHNITYAVMWLFVLLHISLSLRFMLQRNAKTVRDPQLAFRGR